ncbi:Aconitate hydratase mitochondrial [Mucor velutinosus]|uniref:Aconitate hydratase mitochondrial n=1 Tax=Mucor velutinosus TaxID=708070 RepID=A0AAN7DNA5_9FUNG|nr:Aconitate hydratase mitochondrial [Mucor velutinosus]
MKTRALSFVLILLLLQCSIHAVASYKTIIDVLSEDARFSTLIEHLQHTRLIPMINNLEAGTFFAPDNAAFKKYQGQKITKETMLYHLLPQQYVTEDLENGQVLESSYIRPGFLGKEDIGQKLKITEKFDTFFHVNGARIKDKDIFVNRNTTLNVIDQVLEPPQILSQVVQYQDGKLYDLMEKTGIDKLLQEERPFTTFVSATYLLDRFNHVEKNYLISKYGQKDLKELIKYLVISEPIYLNNHPEGETKYTSESGQDITVKVEKNGKIYVNGHKVVEKDVLAANGVLHIVDDLPFANSLVFDTRKYLFGLNATKFVSLVDEYGLGRFLDEGTNNVTILAPTNEVLDEDDIPNNKKVQWLSYHIAQGAYGPEDLENRMLLKTEYNSSQLNHQSQRLLVTVGNDKRDMNDRHSLLKAIRFGDHSKVVGDDMSIGGNAIYRISDPLNLPMDIFSSLVVDLEVSTYVATLYVSGVVDELKHAKAVTLFVPTNAAFKNLGLVSRYLVHPSGRADLQTVLRYHVATSALYYKDLLGDVLEVTTLSNESLIINGRNDDNKVWISTKENTEKDNKLDEHGVLETTDILVSNGVVHKVDHLQIPENVSITHRNLLKGINANTMLNILKKTNLLNQVDLTDCIIMSPTDKAFENEDMESLWNDTDKLVRLAKLHVVPKSEGRKRWFLYPLLGDQVYDTLLSNRDKVVIRELGYGSTIVRVKGQPYGTHARVLDMGRVSTGERSGGVMEIDAVLFPVERGAFGLPWIWSIVIISLIWIASISLLVLGGFLAVKKWKRKRNGYETILEAEQDDIAQEEEEENRDATRYQQQ